MSVERDLIMGIDPGLSGALAVIKVEKDLKNPKRKKLILIDKIKMPTTEYYKLRGKRPPKRQAVHNHTKNPNPSAKSPNVRKQSVDIYKLGMWVGQYAPRVQFAVLEEVGVMTGEEGRVSLFRFGEAFGIAQGVLGSFYIPILFTPPSVWKGSMGLTADKNTSKYLARKLFPNDIKMIAGKPAISHDEAEAIILASFGAKAV